MIPAGGLTLWGAVAILLREAAASVLRAIVARVCPWALATPVQP